MKETILKEHGHFWWGGQPIPEKKSFPDDAVLGILQINGAGLVTLKLEKPLPYDLANMDMGTGTIIQGILKRSNERHVLLIGLDFSSGKEDCLVHECLLGKKSFPFRSDSKLLEFSELSIDLKGYEKWMTLGGRIQCKQDKSKNKLNIAYKKPKNESYDVRDGSLSIEYDYSCEGSFPLLLKESIFLIYTSSKNNEIAFFKRKYLLLRDFFMLLTGSEYSFAGWPSITVSLNGENRRYSFFFAIHRSEISFLEPHYFIFNFFQIRKEFGALFSTWQKKVEEFGPGFYNYLALRRGQRLYTEHSFLTIIQGIESFYNAKHSQENNPTPKLMAKINRILDKIESKKDKGWLANELNRKRDLSLSEKISRILKDLPINLDNKIVGNFSLECARIRNDISHGNLLYTERNIRSREKILENIENKNRALSYCYHVLLLQEIGIKKEMLTRYIYVNFLSVNIKDVFKKSGLGGVRELIFKSIEKEKIEEGFLFGYLNKHLVCCGNELIYVSFLERKNIYMISEIPEEKNIKEKYKNSYIFIKQDPVLLFHINIWGGSTQLMIDSLDFNKMKNDIEINLDESRALGEQIAPEMLMKFFHLILNKNQNCLLAGKRSAKYIF